MATYSAFQVLREWCIRNVHIGEEEAVAILKKTSADATSLDFEGALEAVGIVKRIVDPYNQDVYLREYLKILLKETRPWWLRVFPQGRDRVVAMLGGDQLQCFRSAGLLESFPSSDVVSWWDEMNAFVRKERDIETMIQAREAEKLSFEKERDRLLALEIKREPLWVALEDNSVGYDILSYDIQNGRIVNRLVEVKSTNSGTIYITRNEWNNAISVGANYFFHVWKFPDGALREFPAEEIINDVPRDQGRGIWKNAAIEVEV